MNCSWTKLSEGTDGKAVWGVKVSGNIGEAPGLTGQRVEVRKRDGSTQPVTLGVMRDSWNAGRAATYEVQRAPKNGRSGSGERQPDEKRTEKTYFVRVDVIELDTDTDGGALILRKRWVHLQAARDPKLWRETGADMVRCAINDYGLLDLPGEPKPEHVAAVAAEYKPKKPAAKAAPARRSARKTTTTKKGA
jgi:hypothetical protein